jgi:PAS domain S-box-containing protein
MQAPALSARLSRWAAPAVLAAGLAVSGGLAWLVHARLQSAAADNLSLLAEQVGRELAGDIAAHGTFLRGLHGLFVDAPAVDRERFRRYVGLLRLQHDASLVQHFGFVERQGEAFVVRYVEPPAGNEALPGTDIAGFPPARAALARALAGGGLTLSAPFRMERAAAGDTGLILLLPLYATGDAARPYAASGSRPAAMVGLTINLERSLEQMARSLAQRHVRLRLVERERAGDSEQPSGHPFYDSGQGEAAAWLTASRELEVLGNRWRLDLLAEPAFQPPFIRYAPQATLALCLAIALLLSRLVRNLGRIRRLATAQAQRMTQALRQSEEKFRDLAELASDWFWEQDADFRFTSMSGGVLNKGNFRIEATLGKTRWELPIVGVSEAEWQQHRALLERHEPFRDFVYRIRTADGSMHWYSVSGQPVFDADGRFLGYRGTGHDITAEKQALEALRESENRLALALEAAAAGLWDFDPLARTTYFSPGFAALLGYPDVLALKEGFHFAEALHPEERERALAALRRSLREGAPFDETYRLRRHDGGYRWFRGIGRHFHDETHQTERFVGILLDVTAQRQAEEALRESEARFRRMFEHHASPMLLIDPESGAIVDANSAAAAFYGYPVATLRTMNISAINTLPPEEIARLRQNALHERRNHFEFPHRLADGSQRWVEVHSSPVEVEGRTLLFSVIHDITERRQAQEQLHLAAAVFENSLQGITITDAERRILAVNRAFTQITGYTPEEVLGKNPRLLQSGRHDAAFYRAMWEAIRERGHWQGEIWNRRKNGELFPQLLSIVAVHNGAGERTHYIGIFVEIGELKRAEEALRRLNAELEQRVAERTAALAASNKELEAFSYSVSHDLRAPLRAIDGYAQIIGEDYADRLDEAAQRLLGRIRAASQRMALVTDQLMELARLTRVELQREDVELSALVRSVIDELPRQDGRRVEFAIADGVRAQADPRLLHVVLQNLVHNAWKFTAGREAARIEFGETVLEGERVFYVRDNGAGFDPAHAGKLFGAFQRLHRPDEFAGSGIGLATVARIVRRHGGRVWAEGAVGQGATFYFTLG